MKLNLIPNPLNNELLFIGLYDDIKNLLNYKNTMS